MEFKWIQSFLILTALLQYAAAARGHFLYPSVRDGDDVTLPCENLLQGQNHCDRTDWRFENSANPGTALLVQRGQIGEEAGAESDRLSVTEDCSLVIKKASCRDVGRYLCQQFRPGGQHDTNAFVFLSLLTMTEQRYQDEVTLYCSLSPHEQCKHKVTWVFEGKYVSDQNESVRTLQNHCYSYVVFKIEHRMYKSRYDSLQCEVTADDLVQRFPFRPQSSGEDKRASPFKPTFEDSFKTGIPTTESRNGCSGLDFFMLALRVSELVLVTLLTVLLFRARGNQRLPDYINVRYNRHDETVNYENVEESSASARLH